MRKFLAFLFAVALGLTRVKADIRLTDVQDGGFSVLSAKYAADNKEKAVIYTVGDKDNTACLSIYDDELRLEKEIKISDSPVSATLYTYYYAGESDNRVVENVEKHNDTYYPNIKNLGGCYATQTLFNNDDKYEYVMPIVEALEADRIINEYGEVTVDGQVLRTTGFKVMSEDGSTINTVYLPEGYYLQNYDLLTVNDKSYILVAAIHKVNTESQSEYGGNNIQYNSYNLIYAIDKESSSVKSVSAPIKVTVHPTTPERGTCVDIELEADTIDGGLITVTSASGKVIMNQNIAAGTTHASIDTSSLERGLYIVTVNNGKASRESTKIIIR